MSRPQATLNPQTYECAIVTTDGAGGIDLARATGGIVGVAFTTNGTDGFVSVTIVDQGALTYGMLGNIDGGAAGAILRGAAIANNIARFEAHDPANAGAAIDLAAIATRLTCLIIPAGATPAS